MNWEEIQGNWQQVKGKLRTTWGKLSDDDIERVAGKRTELLGLLQTRYGRAKEHVEREIDLWAKGLK